MKSKVKKMEIWGEELSKEVDPEDCIDYNNYIKGIMSINESIDYGINLVCDATDYRMYSKNPNNYVPYYTKELRKVIIDRAISAYLENRLTMSGYGFIGKIESALKRCLTIEDLFTNFEKELEEIA